jgi:pimeloyl-ACP methyl ester carboxylesterase
MHPAAQVDLLYDFGGNGSIVHVGHANGFPPGTYGPMAHTLKERYHVIALPARPLWPGSTPDSAPSWHPLADDLILGLDALGLSGIAGVGHSLGGVLTLWAAVRRPDLFRAVVLVDPVILPPAWLCWLRLVHWLGLQKRLALVQGALHRRRVWPAHQACFGHYREKPLFARWSDEALWAYVESGLRPRDDGSFELVYPPEWEARIFATTPTGIWHDVRRLQVPALVIRGELSGTFRPQAEARMARYLPQAQFVTIRGAGHLVPMERPAETGAAILDFLEGVAMPVGRHEGPKASTS